MARPCAADDFAAIRARLEELRRARAQLLAEQDRNSASASPPYAVNSGAVAAGKSGLLPSILRALLKVST